MESGFCFYKVIMASENLKIPRALERRGDFPNNISLVDKYRNSWQMKVSRHENELILKNGWPKFYEDNSLSIGDFIFFEYKGNNIFRFKLLGLNACEKEGARGNLPLTREDDDDEDYENDEDEDYEVEDDEDEDYVDDDDDDDDYSGHEQGDEKKRTQISEKSNSNPKSSCPSAMPSGSRQTYATGSMLPRSGSDKQDPPDIYGHDIFRSGLLPKPDNPYFVTRSRIIERTNELFIPKDVMLDHGLNLPEKLLLVDEKGRKWETKVIQWKDGRVRLTRGWKYLCDLNGIKKDDTCICEFVGGEDGERMHMLVRHINVDH